MTEQVDDDYAELSDDEKCALRDRFQAIMAEYFERRGQTHERNGMSRMDSDAEQIADQRKKNDEKMGMRPTTPYRPSNPLTGRSEPSTGGRQP